MLRFKESCSIKKIQPQMVALMIVANEEYSKMGVECVVTSGDDSKHREGSLHYAGDALDFRTININASHDAATPGQLDRIKHALAQRIQDRIGSQFRVAFEATTATRTEHIHGEYRG